MVKMTQGVVSAVSWSSLLQKYHAFWLFSSIPMISAYVMSYVVLSWITASLLDHMIRDIHIH